MDHVVVPLDPAHARRLVELSQAVAAAAGVSLTATASHPHITLVAYTHLDREAVRVAVADSLARTRPFTLRAHGYGFFTGVESTELSLHVPVVRSLALDRLHRAIDGALRRAGAEVAGWCAPNLWTPHITLLDRDLDPVRLGRAVTWLAGGHHSSWRIRVDRVELVGRWSERDRAPTVLRLGAAALTRS